MNKQFLKQEISNLMEVISEQQALVLSHSDRIPQIEMDILMGNLRKVYERLMELNRADQAHTPPVQNIIESRQPEELIASIPDPDLNTEPRNHSTPPAETTGIEQVSERITGTTNNGSAHVQPEMLVASVEMPVEAKTTEIANEAVLPQAVLAKERAREFSKPAGRHATSATLFDDTMTISDKFQGSPTIYDKIAATKEDKSLADKLQKNPVSDLKKSIGINEKFSFINELFDGDPDSYNTVIDLLNNCGNLNEADDLLSNKLAPKYNWTPDGLSFLQLKSLLERRFSA